VPGKELVREKLLFERDQAIEVARPSATKLEGRRVSGV
jgi:hypothetical protein